MFYVYKSQNDKYPYQVLDELIDGVEPLRIIDPFEYLGVDKVYNERIRNKIEFLRYQIEEYEGPIGGLDYYLYGEDE